MCIRDSADTEAEIAEAVDFVVHVERQPGRRVVREVLAPVSYTHLDVYKRQPMCFART